MEGVVRAMTDTEGQSARKKGLAQTVIEIALASADRQFLKESDRD